MNVFRHSSLPAALAIACVLVAGCHGSSKVPPPLPQIALPAGTALKPWKAGDANQAFPSSSTQYGGKVWVTLANLNSFAPAGPGLLVSLVPSVGVQAVIDLGGADEHQCQNPGSVRADSNLLYVGCAGPFAGAGGQGVAEVDPSGAGSVKRFFATPAGVIPGPVAIAGNTIWVGDVGGTNVLPIDRGTGVAKSAVHLDCADNAYISAMLANGSDLYVLCAASDGYLFRLDASTGALKQPRVLVGAQPIAIALTGDSRLAIVNSTSGTLSLVTPGTGSLTVAQDVLKFEKSSDLEDVKSLDQFIYVMSANTQNLIKVDLSKSPPAIVDAVNVNPTSATNSNPSRVEILDDNDALVADAGLGVMVGAQFGKKAP